MPRDGCACLTSRSCARLRDDRAAQVQYRRVVIAPSGTPHPGKVWLARAGTMLLVAGLALLAREASRHSIDFPVYHRAAQQISAGNFDLYPPEAYGGHPGPSQGFRYAPAIAFLVLPFGWLPLEQSAFAFYCLKLAALWWTGATIARRAGSNLWGQRAFVVAFVVIGGYVVEELRFGNAHLFVVALMVLAYDRAESGRVLTPALALAIAIATKITPIALLLYFAVRRRAAVTMATVVLTALLIVLPAAAMGWDGNARQLRAFATYALEKVDEGDNYSLRGVLVRYLTPTEADVSHVQANVASLSLSTVNLIWLIGLLGLGLAALAAVWREVDDPITRLLEFSIVMTGIVLASPHTQRRYFVGLYVPVVVLLALLAEVRHRDHRRLLLAGLVATAAPATVLPLLFGGRRLALLYEAASPYSFGALTLFGVLVALTFRRKSQDAATTT
jgi:hypothetical protein